MQIEDDYSDQELQEILEGRGKFLKLPAVEQDYIRRHDDLKALQEHYPLFRTFLVDCFMDVKGFETDELQQDIADFLQEKLNYKMVQAQREQAKSMIVGAYAVWRLIHDPSLIVLIISAGSDVADEISTWVKMIIDSWDILECLRADRKHGDRTSNTAFDIHWMLKGPDKSPSVRGIGITSNLQGRRAHLLIADDIESSKNGLTPVQRAQLLHLSRDFSSICGTGDIVYLGTPQTVDSLYNTLEERGYTVRIWPGRFPTRDEEPFYGSKLAPWITRKMLDDPSLRTGGGLDGKRGQPTSSRNPEERLCAKELDGVAYFELQFMLNTTASDKNLYPLKPRNLVILDINGDKGPGSLIWLPELNKKVILEGDQKQYDLYYPHNVSEEFYKWEDRAMFIDPAGGGLQGDETVAAPSFLLHGYIWVPEMYAAPGGHRVTVFEEIAQMAVRWRIYKITIEENMDHGAFAKMLQPVLAKAFMEAGLPGYPTLTDHWESTNKEKRIIDTLEPIMARHKLVLSPEILSWDVKSTFKYPAAERVHYQLLNQLSRITYQKGCLVHDDRIDALAGTSRIWIDKLNVMDKQIEEDNHRKEFLDMINGLTPKDKRKANIKNRRSCFTIRNRR